MRIIYMGTPDIAVPALESIINAGYDVAAVVTQPDRAKGRSKKPVFSPVKEAALAHGIKVLQPEKARDAAFKDELRALDIDAVVVMAFGQILDAELLGIPRYGCINIHASLLPEYRGAAPISAVILNGEKKTGVTTMFMDEGLDTGDILLVREIAIDPKETTGTLEEKIAAVGGDLIVKTLKELEAGTLKRIPQTGGSSYVRMIKKQQGMIDWAVPAVEIERKIRAFNPWPGAFTSCRDLTIKLFDADVCEGGGAPGEIIACKGSELVVAAGSGALMIKELQAEGKKRMKTADFQNGFKLSVGEVLGR